MIDLGVTMGIFSVGASAGTIASAFAIVNDVKLQRTLLLLSLLPFVVGLSLLVLAV